MAHHLQEEFQALKTGQDLEQGGFSRPVSAHQAHPVTLRNHPVCPFEQELVAIALSGCGELNHGADSIVSRVSWFAEDLEWTW